MNRVSTNLLPRSLAHSSATYPEGTCDNVSRCINVWPRLVLEFSRSTYFAIDVNFYEVNGNDCWLRKRDRAIEHATQSRAYFAFLLEKTQFSVIREEPRR